MFVSQIFDEASEILATTDTNKVFRKLTQAVQTLMESGHYFHTTQEVDVCTGWDGQTITLPRGIEVPLAVNVDGSPTYFRGRLFQYHVNKGGVYNPVDWAWDDRGFVATVMDIRQPSQLVSIAEHTADAGKTIRVIGTDSRNRPLRTQFPDGTTADGLIVPIHAQTDFPYGTIEPDGVTIVTRELKIDPLTRFSSNEEHQLSSGQEVVFTTNGSGTPNFLYAGNTYYIGVDDDKTIQLYQSQIDAISASNPIFLQSILGVDSIKLTDSRQADLNTVVNFQSIPPVTIDSPNELTFTVGTGTGFASSLPTPLESNTTYFGQSLDSLNIAVYPTLLDAQNKTNQIFLSGNSGKFNTDVRKNIAPQTLLTFAIPHYFQTGDQVQAFTNGGALPSPLISSQNYFVNVISDLSISLHRTSQDAVNSISGILINPIILTDSGVGTNTIVKLIPASATSGTSNQITASGLKLDTPEGTGAQFTAVVVGAVISVSVNSGGAGYCSTPTVTFSNPPSPPAGSSQTVYPATGYAIMIPEAPGSAFLQVGSIVLTSSGLGYTTAPVISIAPPASSCTSTTKTTASATAVIQTSFVSSFKLSSGGFGYTQPPQIKISGGGGLGASALANIDTSVNSITSNGDITDGLTASGATATCVIPSGHNYINNQTIEISGVTNSTLTNGYNGKHVIVVPTIDQLINSPSTSGNLTGSGFVVNCHLIGHGYQDGQTIKISGALQTYYNGSFVINVIDSDNFQYQTLTSILVSPATTTIGIYSSVPDSTKFTFAVSSGQNSPAVGNITSFSGSVTGLTVITQGSGYTSAPSVTITPSTGVFIEFSSTGTLPSPLVAGTAYRAESPLNKTTGNFTVVNADFSPITISGTATGNFSVVLSRPFAIGFNNYWSGDFSGINTGQVVYLSSDYILPTGVNNTSQYFVKKINESVCQLYTSALLTNLIIVTAIGVGQSYFGIRIPSYAKAYNDLVILSDIQFLKQGIVVRFSCTGTLPSPLDENLEYIISISGNSVSVTTLAGDPIVFENNGVPTLPIGQMSMDVVRVFYPDVSTKLICNSSIFEIGEQVSVRANNNDVLPNGLNASLNYYARPIDSSSLELYNTRNNASNLESTAGRIEYQTSGNSVDSTFFSDSILPPILVKSIQHVEKPETIGYVSLYAWDNGRSNDMALVGQYHPTETNPKYRRIRIGKNCAWARIIYRVTAPTITSVYDYIPLENERAIIAGVHACDLEDKDFMEQAQKYWAAAIAYLRNQHESMEGHAMQPPQINNITYGDYSDPVMF